MSSNKLTKVGGVTVEGADISVVKFQDAKVEVSDFISLTDMVSVTDGTRYHLENWIRTRNTVSFLGEWERRYNPDFDVAEWKVIENSLGRDNLLSVKKWVKRTNAIGIRSVLGRWGGTYAHRDIAIEFATYISPGFKLSLINEYVELKCNEAKRNNIEWDFKRELVRANYAVMTNEIKASLPPEITPECRDMISRIIFGTSAQQKDDSVMDTIILAELEQRNAEMIAISTDKAEREERLREIAHWMKCSLENTPGIQRLQAKYGCSKKNKY